MVFINFRTRDAQSALSDERGRALSRSGVHQRDPGSVSERKREKERERCLATKGRQSDATSRGAVSS